MGVYDFEVNFNLTFDESRVNKIIQKLESERAAEQGLIEEFGNRKSSAAKVVTTQEEAISGAYDAAIRSLKEIIETGYYRGHKVTNDKGEFSAQIIHEIKNRPSKIEGTAMGSAKNSPELQAMQLASSASKEFSESLKTINTDFQGFIKRTRQVFESSYQANLRDTKGVRDFNDIAERVSRDPNVSNEIARQGLVLSPGQLQSLTTGVLSSIIPIVQRPEYIRKLQGTTDQSETFLRSLGIKDLFAAKRSRDMVSNLGEVNRNSGARISAQYKVPENPDKGKPAPGGGTQHYMDRRFTDAGFKALESLFSNNGYVAEVALRAGVLNRATSGKNAGLLSLNRDISMGQIYGENGLLQQLYDAMQDKGERTIFGSVNPNGKRGNMFSTVKEDSRTNFERNLNNPYVSAINKLELLLEQIQLPEGQRKIEYLTGRTYGNKRILYTDRQSDRASRDDADIIGTSVAPKRPVVSYATQKISPFDWERRALQGGLDESEIKAPSEIERIIRAIRKSSWMSGIDKYGAISNRTDDTWYDMEESIYTRALNEYLRSAGKAELKPGQKQDIIKYLDLLSMKGTSQKTFEDLLLKRNEKLGYNFSGTHGLGEAASIRLIDSEIARGMDKYYADRAAANFRTLGYTDEQIKEMQLTRPYAFTSSGGFDYSSFTKEYFMRMGFNETDASKQARVQLNKAMDASSKIFTPSTEMFKLDLNSDAVKNGEFVFIDSTSVKRPGEDNRSRYISPEGKEKATEVWDGLISLSTALGGYAGQSGQVRGGIAGKGSAIFLEDPMAYLRSVGLSTIDTVGNQGYNISGKNILGVIDSSFIKHWGDYEFAASEHDVNDKGEAVIRRDGYGNIVWRSDANKIMSDMFKAELATYGFGMIRDYSTIGQSDIVGAQLGRQLQGNPLGAIAQARLLTERYNRMMGKDVNEIRRTLYNNEDSKMINSLLTDLANPDNENAGSTERVRADIKNWYASQLRSIARGDRPLFDTDLRGGYEQSAILSNNTFRMFQQNGWDLDKSKMRNPEGRDAFINKFIDWAFGTDTRKAGLSEAEIKSLGISKDRSGFTDKIISGLLSNTALYSAEDGRKLTDLFFSNTGASTVAAGMSYRNPGQTDEYYNAANSFALLKPFFDFIGDYTGKGSMYNPNVLATISGGDYDGDVTKVFGIRGLNIKTMMKDLGLDETDRVAQTLLGGTLTSLNATKDNFRIVDQYGEQLRAAISKYELMSPEELKKTGADKQLAAYKEIVSGTSDVLAGIKTHAAVQEALSRIVISPKAAAEENQVKSKIKGSPIDTGNYVTNMWDYIQRETDVARQMGQASNVAAKGASVMMLQASNQVAFDDMLKKMLAGNIAYDIASTNFKKERSIELPWYNEFSQVGNVSSRFVDLMQNAKLVKLGDGNGEIENGKTVVGIYGKQGTDPGDMLHTIRAHEGDSRIYITPDGQTAYDLRKLRNVREDNARGIFGYEDRLDFLNHMGFAASDVTNIAGMVEAYNMGGAGIEEQIAEQKNALYATIERSKIFASGRKPGEEKYAIFNTDEEDIVKNFAKGWANYLVETTMGKKVGLNEGEIYSGLRELAAVETVIDAAAQRKYIDVSGGKPGAKIYKWEDDKGEIQLGNTAKMQEDKKKNPERVYTPWSQAQIANDIKRDIGWFAAAGNLGIADVGNIGTSTRSLIAQFRSLANSDSLDPETKKSWNAVLDRLQQDEQSVGTIGAAYKGRGDLSLKEEAAFRQMLGRYNRNAFAAGMDTTTYGLDKLGTNIDYRALLNPMTNSLYAAFEEIKDLGKQKIDGKVRGTTVADKAAIFKKFGFSNEISNMLASQGIMSAEDFGNMDAISLMRFAEGTRNFVQPGGNYTVHDTEDVNKIYDTLFKSLDGLATKAKVAAAATQALNDTTDERIAAQKKLAQAEANGNANDIKKAQAEVTRLTAQEEELKLFKDRLQTQTTGNTYLDAIKFEANRELLTNELAGYAKHFRAVVQPYEGMNILGSQAELPRNPEVGPPAPFFGAERKDQEFTYGNYTARARQAVQQARELMLKDPGDIRNIMMWGQAKTALENADVAYAIESKQKIGNLLGAQYAFNMPSVIDQYERDRESSKNVLFGENGLYNIQNTLPLDILKQLQGSIEGQTQAELNKLIGNAISSVNKGSATSSQALDNLLQEIDKNREGYRTKYYDSFINDEATDREKLKALGLFEGFEYKAGGAADISDAELEKYLEAKLGPAYKAARNYKNTIASIQSQFSYIDKDGTKQMLTEDEAKEIFNKRQNVALHNLITSNTTALTGERFDTDLSVQTEDLYLTIKHNIENQIKTIKEQLNNPDTSTIDVLSYKNQLAELEKKLAEHTIGNVKYALEQTAKIRGDQQAIREQMIFNNATFANSSLDLKSSDAFGMMAGMNTPGMLGRRIIGMQIGNYQQAINADQQALNYIQSKYTRLEKNEKGETRTVQGDITGKADIRNATRLNERIKQNQVALTGLQDAYTGFGAVAIGTLAKVGQAMNRYITRMIRQAWTEAKKFAKEFDAAMNTIQQVTLKSDKEMNSVRDTAISKAKELKMSITDITKIQTALYRQGLSETDVNKRTDIVAKYSKVTGQDITSSLKSLTTAVSSGLVDNLQQAADVLVALGDAAATTAQEIAKGMQKSAVAAYNAGMSYEELTALLTVGTAKTQLGGSQIGRSLNSIISRMTRVSTSGYDTSNDTSVSINDVEQALANVGIDLRESATEFRSVTEIFKDLAGVWENLTDVQKANISYTLAGTTQSNVFQTLLSAMSEDNMFEELLNEAKDSEGTLDSKYEIAMESFNSSLTALKTAFDSLVENMSPVISLFQGLADMLTWLLNGFSETGIIGSIAALTTAFTAIAGIAIIVPKIAAAMLGLNTLTVAASHLTTAAIALDTAAIHLTGSSASSSISALSVGGAGMLSGLISKIGPVIAKIFPYVLAAAAATGVITGIVSEVIKLNSSNYINNKLISEAQEYNKATNKRTTTLKEEALNTITKYQTSNDEKVLLKNVLTSEGFEELKTIVQALGTTIPDFTDGLDLATITLEEFREKLTNTADDVSLAQNRKTIDAARKFDYKDYDFFSGGTWYTSSKEDLLYDILNKYIAGSASAEEILFAENRIIPVAFAMQDFNESETVNAEWYRKRLISGESKLEAAAANAAYGIEDDELITIRNKIKEEKAADLYTVASSALTELGFTDDEQKMLGESFVSSISDSIGEMDTDEIKKAWQNWINENVYTPMYSGKTSKEDVVSKYSPHKYSIIGGTPGVYYSDKDEAIKAAGGNSRRVVDITSGQIVGSTAQSYLDTTQYNQTELINKLDFAAYVSTFKSLDDFFASMNSSSTNIEKYAGYLSDDNLSKAALQVASGEKSFKDFIDAVNEYVASVIEEVAYSTERLGEIKQYSQDSILRNAIIDGTATDQQYIDYADSIGISNALPQSVIKSFAIYNRDQALEKANEYPTNFATQLINIIASSAVAQGKDEAQKTSIGNRLAEDLKSVTSMSDLIKIAKKYGVDVSAYESEASIMDQGYTYSGVTRNTNTNITEVTLDETGRPIYGIDSRYGVPVSIDPTTGAMTYIADLVDEDGRLQYIGFNNNKSYKFTQSEFGEDNKVSKVINNADNVQYSISTDSNGSYVEIDGERIYLNNLAAGTSTGDNYYTGTYGITGSVVAYTPEQIAQMNANSANTKGTYTNAELEYNASVKLLEGELSPDEYLATLTSEQKDYFLTGEGKDFFAKIKSAYDSSEIATYNGLLNEGKNNAFKNLRTYIATGVTDSAVSSYLTATTDEEKLSALGTMITRKQNDYTANELLVKIENGTATVSDYSDFANLTGANLREIKEDPTKARKYYTAFNAGTATQYDQFDNRMSRLIKDALTKAEVKSIDTGDFKDTAEMVEWIKNNTEEAGEEAVKLAADWEAVNDATKQSTQAAKTYSDALATARDNLNVKKTTSEMISYIQSAGFSMKELDEQLNSNNVWASIIAGNEEASMIMEKYRQGIALTGDEAQRLVKILSGLGSAYSYEDLNAATTDLISATNNSNLSWQQQQSDLIYKYGKLDADKQTEINSLYGDPLTKMMSARTVEEFTAALAELNAAMTDNVTQQKKPISTSDYFSNIWSGYSGYLTNVNLGNTTDSNAWIKSVAAENAKYDFYKQVIETAKKEGGVGTYTSEQIKAAEEYFGGYKYYSEDIQTAMDSFNTQWKSLDDTILSSIQGYENIVTTEINNLKNSSWNTSYEAGQDAAKTQNEIDTFYEWVKNNQNEDWSSYSGWETIKNNSTISGIYNTQDTNGTKNWNLYQATTGAKNWGTTGKISTDILNPVLELLAKGDFAGARRLIESNDTYSAEQIRSQISENYGADVNALLNYDTTIDTAPYYKDIVAAGLTAYNKSELEKQKTYGYITNEDYEALSWYYNLPLNAESRDTEFKSYIDNTVKPFITEASTIADYTKQLDIINGTNTKAQDKLIADVLGANATGDRTADLNTIKMQITPKINDYNRSKSSIAAVWNVLSEAEKKSYLESIGVTVGEGADLEALFTTATTIDASKYKGSFEKSLYQNPFAVNNAYYQQEFLKVLQGGTDYTSTKALIDSIPGLEQWIQTNDAATTSMSNLYYNLTTNAKAAEEFAQSIGKGTEALEQFKSTSRSLNSTIQSMNFIVSEMNWSDSQKNTVATALGYSSWADYIERGGTEEQARSDYAAMAAAKEKERIDNLNAAIGTNYYDKNGNIVSDVNSTDYAPEATVTRTMAAGSTKEEWMALGFDAETAEKLAYENRNNAITLTGSQTINKTNPNGPVTRWNVSSITSDYDYIPREYYSEDAEKLRSLASSTNPYVNEERNQIYSSWYKTGREYNQSNRYMTKLLNGTITDAERKDLANYLGLDYSQLLGANAYNIAYDAMQGKTTRINQTKTELGVNLSKALGDGSGLSKAQEEYASIEDIAQEVVANAEKFDDATVQAAKDLIAYGEAMKKDVLFGEELAAAVNAATDTENIKKARNEMATYLDTHSFEEFKAALADNDTWQTAILNTDAYAEALARIEANGLSGAAAIAELQKALRSLNKEMSTEKLNAKVDEFRSITATAMREKWDTLTSEEQAALDEEAPWIRMIATAGDSQSLMEGYAEQAGYYSQRDYRNTSGAMYDETFGQYMYDKGKYNHIINSSFSTQEQKDNAAIKLAESEKTIWQLYGSSIQAQKLWKEFTAGTLTDTSKLAFLRQYTGIDDLNSAAASTFMTNDAALWKDRIDSKWITTSMMTSAQSYANYLDGEEITTLKENIAEAKANQKAIDDYTFTTREQLLADLGYIDEVANLLNDKTITSDTQLGVQFGRLKSSSIIYGSFGASSSDEAQQLYNALISGDLTEARRIYSESKDRENLAARYTSMYGGAALEYIKDEYNSGNTYDKESYDIAIAQDQKTGALNRITRMQQLGTYTAEQAAIAEELVNNFNYATGTYEDKFWQTKANEFDVSGAKTTMSTLTNQISALQRGASSEEAKKAAQAILGDSYSQYTPEEAITQALSIAQGNLSTNQQTLDNYSTFWSMLSESDKQLYLDEINKKQGTKWTTADFEAAIGFDASKYASSSEAFTSVSAYKYATPMYQTSFYDALMSGAGEGLSNAEFLANLSPDMIEWLTSGNAGTAGDIYTDLVNGQTSLTKATREYAKEIGKDAVTQNNYIKSLAKTKEELRNIRYYLDKEKFDKSEGSDDLKDLASILGLSEETIKKMEDGDIVRMLESQYKAIEQQYLEGLEDISRTFSTFDASDFVTGTDANGNIKVNVGGIELVAGEGIKTVGIDEAIAMAKALGEDTLVQELEAIAEEEGKVSLDVWETTENGKPTVHAAWKGVELKGIKGAKSSSGSGGGKSAADELIDKWKNRISVSQHRINMLDKEAEGYKNKGELTNYGSVLSYKRDELLALKSEYEQANEELEKLYATTSKGTKNSDAEDAIKLRDQIFEYEEAIADINNQLEENTRLLEENKEAIRQTRITLEETVRTEIENRRQIERDMLDGQVSLENSIIDAIKERYQAEWNLMRENYEKQKEALEQEKSLLQERVDARRNAANEAEKAEELAEYKRQLAIVQMDSTRTKDALELQKKIADLEKEIGQTREDEMLAQQQQAIDDEEAAIDDLISAGESELEVFLSDANNFATELNEILAMSQEDLLDWLRDNVTEFALSTEAAGEQMINSWTDTYEQWKHIINKWNTEIDDILGTKEGFLEYMKQSDEYVLGDDEVKESLLYQWGKAYDEFVSAYKDDNATWGHTDDWLNEKVDSISTDTSSIKDSTKDTADETKKLNMMTESFKDACEKQAKEAAEKQGITIEALKDIKTSSSSDTSRIITPLELINSNIESILAKAKSYSETTISVVDTGSTSTTSWYSEFGPKTSPTSPITKFATGGLVDYTGWAWLDGTPSAPEYVLSANQWDTIASAIKPLTTSYIPSMYKYSMDNAAATTNNTINATINVTGSLNSDADLDALAEKIGDKFTEQLGNRGFNTRWNV